MMVKSIQFERKNLKYINYKNDYHIYKSMNTTTDNINAEIPESVIKVLYRICLKIIENM